MSPLYYLELFAAFMGIACFTLGFLIFLKQHRQPAARFLALFIIFVSLWILSVYYADISTNLSELVIWTKLAAIFALGFITTFIVFVYLFRYPSAPAKKYLWFYFPALPVALFSAFFDNDKVYQGNPFETFTYDRPVGGLLNNDYYLYVFVILLYYIISLIVLLKGRRQLPFHTQNQIRYISLGAGISLAAGILFDGVLPVLGVDYLYALGPALSAFLVFFTTYAIIKHRLLDIRIVIQRGLVFAVLLGLIIGVYLAAVFIVEALFRRATGVTVLFSAGFTAVVGIFSVPFLERYFRRVTDKLFFKDRYDYAQAVQEFTETLHRSIYLKEIIGKISALLQHIFKTIEVSVSFFPSNGTVPLSDPVSLSQQDSSVSVPLMLEGNFRGAIKVGKKLSGDPYTNEDIKLLHTFSSQAAIALERARLYEAAKQYSQELEEKVKQRTKEIQELQEQQKQMMFDMSHAIQTPLTVLKGELESFRKRVPFEGQAAIFERSVDRITQFTDDLLKLARLEAIKNEVRLEPVNFSEVVNDVLEYVGVVCEERGIVLVRNIEPTVMVAGQKDKLEEIVANLLSNAIKYIIQDGEKKIITTLCQAGDNAEFLVQDTGRGIHPEDLPHIFKRFYQPEYAKDQTTQGTGLGLAICKKIVELHGGQIRVESYLNSGTKFTVSLPLLT